MPDLHQKPRSDSRENQLEKKIIKTNYHSTGLYENLDQAEEVKNANQPAKESLAKNFPGLSIPNKNQEEIELDFDFEAIIETKLEESKNHRRRNSSASSEDKKRKD